MHYIYFNDQSCISFKTAGEVEVKEPSRNSPNIQNPIVQYAIINRPCVVGTVEQDRIFVSLASVERLFS